MGLTMLRMDTARARWKAKLEAAFATKADKADREGKGVKWILFTLPFITVLREGLEAVVFIGGVCSLIRFRLPRVLRTRTGVPGAISVCDSYPGYCWSRLRSSYWVHHLQDFVSCWALYRLDCIYMPLVPHWCRFVQQVHRQLPTR